MTLDELLNSLFPAGHDARVEAEGILCGTASYGAGKTAAVVGVVNQTPLGIDGAVALAGHVLEVIRHSPERPIVVLLDGMSQRMRRRDEMLGLNEYLAHLTKCFTLASRQGPRTVGVIFGRRDRQTRRRRSDCRAWLNRGNGTICCEWNPRPGNGCCPPGGNLPASPMSPNGPRVAGR